MRRVGIIALLLFVVTCQLRAADQQVFLDLVMTNANGSTNIVNAVVVNGSTRIFTNNVSSSPSTLIMATNNQLRAATNMFVHFGVYPPPGTGIEVIRVNTNTLRIQARVNDTITFSLAGNWGTATLRTNPVGVRGVDLALPITRYAATNQTNYASWMAQALDKSTSAISQVSYALANFINLSLAQTFGNKAITNSTFDGGTIGPTEVPEIHQAFMDAGTPDKIFFVASGVTNAYLRSTPNGSGPGIYSFITDTALDASAPDDTAVLINYYTLQKLSPALVPNPSRGANEWSITNYWYGTENIFQDGVTAYNLKATNVTLGNASGTFAVLIVTNLQALTGSASLTNLIATNGYLGSVFINGGAISNVTSLNGTIGQLLSGIINGSRATNILGLHGTNEFLTGGTFSNVIAVAMGISASTYSGTIVNLTNGNVYGVALFNPTMSNASGAFSSMIATNLSAFGGVLSNLFAQQLTMSNAVTIHVTNLVAVGTLIATNVAVTGVAQTNSSFGGTNQYTGDHGFTPYDINSLANGNNIAVAFTNVNVNLVGAPTTAFTINGVYGGRHGRHLHVKNMTGQTLTLAHESGVDPTAANRIHLYPEADQTYSHGQEFELWYYVTTNGVAFNRWSTAKPESTVVSTNQVGTVQTNGTTISSAARVENFLAGGNGHLSWKGTNTGGVVDLEIRDNIPDMTYNAQFSTNGNALTLASGFKGTNADIYASSTTTQPLTINLAAGHNSDALRVKQGSATVGGFDSNGLATASVSNAVNVAIANYTIFNQTNGPSGMIVSNITTTKTPWFGSGKGSQVLTQAFWQPGRRAKLEGWGRIYTPASPGNMALFVDLNGTTVGTNYLTSVLPANLVNDPWRLEVTLTCLPTTNTVACNGMFNVWSATAGTLLRCSFILATSATFDPIQTAGLVNFSSTNGASTIGIHVDQMWVGWMP